MLLRHTLGKIDGHLGADQAPVLPLPSPLFRNVHHSQIQHFQQAVIDGKDGFGLGYTRPCVSTSAGFRTYK